MGKCRRRTSQTEETQSRRSLCGRSSASPGKSGETGVQGMKERGGSPRGAKGAGFYPKCNGKSEQSFKLHFKGASGRCWKQWRSVRAQIQSSRREWVVAALGAEVTDARRQGRIPDVFWKQSTGFPGALVLGCEGKRETKANSLILSWTRWYLGPCNDRETLGCGVGAVVERPILGLMNLSCFVGMQVKISGRWP